MPTNLRELARGQPCQIRIPGHCTHNTEETVLCHAPGGGMGTKTSDLQGAWGCYACHALVDGAVKSSYSRDEILLMFYEGMSRTLAEVSKIINL